MFFRSSRHLFQVEPSCSSARAVTFFRSSRYVWADPPGKDAATGTYRAPEVGRTAKHARRDRRAGHPPDGGGPDRMAPWDLVGEGGAAPRPRTRAYDGAHAPRGRIPGRRDGG